MFSLPVVKTAVPAIETVPNPLPTSDHQRAADAVRPAEEVEEAEAPVADGLRGRGDGDAAVWV